MSIRGCLILFVALFLLLAVLLWLARRPVIYVIAEVSNSLPTSGLARSQEAVVVYRINVGPDDQVSFAWRTSRSETWILKDYDDRSPHLVEVASEGDLIGVLLCSSGAPDMRIDFSRTSGRVVPNSQRVSAAIASNLVRRYGLTAGDLAKFGNDPLRWACASDSDGFGRFRDILIDKQTLPALPPIQ